MYPTTPERLLGGNAAEVALGALPVQEMKSDNGQGSRLFNKTG
jgi:hypothetical protein